MPSDINEMHDEQLDSAPGVEDAAAERNAGAAPAEISAAFEELTLDVLLGRWLRAPKQTWQQLRRALAGSASAPARSAPSPTLTVPRPALPTARLRPGRLLQAKYAQLLVYALAILSGLFGSAIARGTADISRHNDLSLHLGGRWLLLGFLLWLAAEFIGWRARRRAAQNNPPPASQQPFIAARLPLPRTFRGT